MTGLLPPTRRCAKPVPLSLRERAGVRGTCTNARNRKGESPPASPHPDPLPEGEGDLERTICKTLPTQPPMLRRGYSLIEMIVAMTVGSVIIGIAVGILHRAAARRSGRAAIACPQARILARLGRAVPQRRRRRRAADSRRAAGGVAVRPAGRSPGMTYRLLPGEVRRDERMAGKLARQESYVLPSGWSAAIAVEERGRASRASLVSSRDHGAVAGQPAAKCALPPCWARTIGSPSRRSGGQ